MNLAGTIGLLVVFRRRIGRIEGRRTLDAYARIAVASLAAAGVAYGSWSGLDALLGRSLGAQTLSVGLAVTAGAAAFLLLARILRIGELDALLSLVRRRRNR